MKKTSKEDQIIIDLINKMFEIAGHNVTYEDIKGRKDDWFNEWTMTMEQRNEWDKWGKKLIMKKLHMSAHRAEREMAWAGLAWGLKFSIEEESI